MGSPKMGLWLIKCPKVCQCVKPRKGKGIHTKSLRLGHFLNFLQKVFFNVDSLCVCVCVRPKTKRAHTQTHTRRRKEEEEANNKYLKKLGKLYLN